MKISKKGFTLIELIIVISILGILSAVSIPKFIGYREKANLAADKYNAKIIGDALNYAYINGDITLNNNGKSFSGKDSTGNTISFTGSGRSFEKVFVPKYIDKRILDEDALAAAFDHRLYIFTLTSTTNNIKIDVSYNPDSNKYSTYGNLSLYTINLTK
ncbi:type II secretion system protein [Clostridium grantii]|uniref:Prepilin-type N-terminal cleavage/methylation domain-containing protein n=1 Tax=Clostridium grantii DSM 8605 TaxID=1121316 RepID=A0A1M5VFN5_9CLOT|nr:prepilin-type N-terminal cleavage/methylation domain-containing protein [Clostridium grantii]SHH73958.1 prepilin-type N-terminal cleavage/methylation domain-containing protein [Clostridium grantii DSM 8605]